jgi:hypothetical protein
LPNYFVGVGLLLTFFGLVAALRFASSAVGADVPEATNALKNLLAAATFKFGTSIAGLFSSIVFSVVYHYRVKQLDDSFEALCRELERLTVFIAPEALAQDQLRQLEEQTTQLELFNTKIGLEIADRLGSRLDASLAESLRAAIEPLGGAVDRLAKGLAEQNVDALRRMADDFRQSLAAGAGEEFRNIAGTLKTLQGSLDRTGAQLGERLGEAGDRAATRLDAATEALVKALQPFSERLLDAERGLGELVKELGDLIIAFKGASANAESAAGALADAGERMRAAATPVADTATGLAAVLEGIAAARAGLTSLTEQIGALSAALARSWQSYAERFDEVDGRLEQVFREFRTGTEGYHEVVREFVKELDGSLSKATLSLAGGVEDLRGAIEDLGEAAARQNGHDPRPELPT